MIEPEDEVQDDWLIRAVRGVRMVTAWLALLAAFSFLVTVVFFHFPGPSQGPAAPSSPLWALRWRNWSLLAAFVFGVISIPKWQSWTAMIVSFLLLVFSLVTYD